MAEEDVAVAGVEWEEEVHPVIINYDVLENIFSFLKPTDVKEARLVCKVWGSVGKKELGNQTFLSIDKLDFGNLGKDEVPAVHPHLLRRIKIHIERGLTVCSTRPVHFLPFLTIHRSKIEELLFEGEDYFLHPIQTVLEAVEFPNLRKISLHELDQDEEEVLPPSGEFLTPRLSIVLNTVKKLEFWPSEHFVRINGTCKFSNKRNFPLFQEIINKCPNLEGLKVYRQFYPDLSSCVNLKSLEWVGPSSKMSSTDGLTKIVYQGRDFYVERIIEMLTPIKGRLENLSLGSPLDQEADGRDLSRFGDISIHARFDPRGRLVWNPVEYPSMPKLTKLFVSDVNVFGISSQSFNRDRLPALKRLTLRSTKKYELPIELLLTHSNHVNYDKVKLESISLNQVPLGAAWMWERISSNYPNLKELVLGCMAGQDRMDLTKEIVCNRNPGRFKYILTSLSINIVNLEKLTIEIKFACSFYGLLNAICVNGFKDNNSDSKKVSLKLVAPDPELIIDPPLDGPPKIWESILIYKNLTFQGFGRIRADTRKKLQDFVVGRDLKDVYFLQ